MTFQRPILRAVRLGLTALLLTLPAIVCAQQPSPPILPDPKLTPGATLPVTVDDIKVPGYTKKVRNVPEDVKRQVYAEYGITSHGRGEYEVDHLISLELGGSNSIKNLWPQSYRTQPWNAHVKDALEDRLHAMVVAGRTSLPDAQRAIAMDWIAEYKKVFNTQVPLAAGESGSGKGAKSGHGRRRRGTEVQSDTAPPSVTVPAAGVPDTGGVAAGGQVWVNTKSGKFFRPGSRYYGKTKQGRYMTEGAATRAGYVPAGGQ